MESCSNKLDLQHCFDQDVDIKRGPIALIQHLKNVSFFMKDRDFRIIHGNEHFYRRFGFKTELDIVGKNDFDLFPKPLAKKFRRDDQNIMTTNRDMLGIIELFLNRQRLPDWYVTNKMPVYSKQGETIGVMGTIQRLDQDRALATTDHIVTKLIQLIIDDPGRQISFAELAEENNISHRHLDRRFKQATGITPQQFLNRKRIEVACEMLRSQRTPILTIALDLGYCDQSAFTTQFRQCMGITPLKYRNEFRTS